MQALEPTGSSFGRAFAERRLRRRQLSWFGGGETTGGTDVYGRGGALNYYGYCQRLVTRTSTAPLERDPRRATAAAFSTDVRPRDGDGDVPRIPLYQIPVTARSASSSGIVVAAPPQSPLNARTGRLERAAAADRRLAPSRSRSGRLGRRRSRRGGDGRVRAGSSRSLPVSNPSTRDVVRDRTGSRWRDRRKSPRGAIRPRARFHAARPRLDFQRRRLSLKRPPFDVSRTGHPPRSTPERRAHRSLAGGPPVHPPSDPEARSTPTI